MYIVDIRKCTKTQNWKHYWRRISTKCKRHCTYIRTPQQGIYYRLKWFGKVEKQTNCFLEPFLHHIIAGYQKWFHYDKSKKRKAWRPPGHFSTSIAKPNIQRKNECRVFGEISLLSCFMSWSKRMKPLLGLSIKYSC